MFIFLCTLTALAVSSNEAARILGIFPAPSVSHQVAFRPLTQELAKRGHEVVVITPDPAFPKGGTPPNLTEIDVHDQSYSILRKYTEEISRGDTDFITQMGFIMQVVAEVVAKYPSTKEIQKIIDTQKFDLLLIESIARPALIYSHIFKVPVIQVSSFGAIFSNYDVIGAPTHPILYPSIMRRRIHNLSMWEKISETYNYLLLNNAVDKYEDTENAMLKKHFGDDVPSVRDLYDNVDMLFLNIHPIFEGIRPVPPSVLYMGGIHQNPEKELPADLKSYLDGSKNGVIYFSFGTNVLPSLLPAEKIQAIIKVFSDLPYDILWKYDKDELPNKPNNVRIGKWFPQSDLLRHPNIKLFITQGGLQSTDEAITAGVPLICVPILADQWFNGEKYEYLKIGVRIEMENLNYDNLKNAINTITGDKSYRQNIVRLHSLMQDEPIKPLDRAVWWTEYVIRNGGAKHLRSPAANISWTQYLELDVVLILLAGLFIAVSLVLTVLYFVFVRIFEVLASNSLSLKKNKSM